MSRELTFEKALERLEETVKDLEQGELSLSDSLDAFETGIKLTKFCSNKLTEAEAKIEIIKEENGVVKTEDYNYKDKGEE